MKQVNPGESSEPVKLPSPAVDAAQSPQQVLNNYTAAQAAPADSAPVAQPANPPVAEVKPAEPAVSVKPEVVKEVKPELVKEAKPEVVKEAKPEPVKETKPAAKPAETKVAEAPKADPAKVTKPADEAAKPVENKAAKVDEKPKMKQEKTADAPVGIAASSKKLSKMDENAYVLQIMVTNSSKKVEDILAGAPNKKDLAAYKTVRDGKEVFIVVEGEYPNANAAASAAKNLPSMQQSAKPWPKKVGLIHAEIKSP